MYGAKINWERYEEIFLRRRDGENLILPRGMEATFTTNPSTQHEKAIAALIKEWNIGQIAERRKELAIQQDKLVEAEEKLKVKETKTALEKKRIALKKIPWLREKMKYHQKSKAVESDFRIFPMNWVSMVHRDTSGDLTIAPFRYHIRPTYENDPKYDCKRPANYNTRRDKLRTTWKSQFGNKHGLLLVESSWENVKPDKYSVRPLSKEQTEQKNIVIHFEPDDGQWMEVPTIYDVWSRPGKPALYGTGLITDDPLEEIAQAGHDRTPISLSSSAAQQWLAKTGSRDELFDLLSDIRRPYYEHAIAA